MKYAFFDTESSNCYGNCYKMCEWGTFVTDSAFNPIPGTNKDILINPGRDGKFNLTGRKDGRDLVLAHEEREYRFANTFDHHYDNIKFFLEQKDTMFFLWAAENDIQVIIDQCIRYRLPKISFVTHDVQMLFKKEFPEVKDTPSLEKAMEILGLSMDGIVQHRPDEDSRMTMMVLKALCEKTGKSAEELIAECPKCRMESLSAYDDLQRRHAENVKRKEAGRALAKLMETEPDPNVPKERTFTVSAEMKRHIVETIAAIKRWISRGYYFRTNLDVGYLVYYDENNKNLLIEQLRTDEFHLVSIDEFDGITGK